MTANTTIPQIDPANATVAWDQLSTQVDALIGAWQAGERPPTLSRFLPAEPLELRRLVLVELVKVDLEYRWQQHKLPKTIEEYVAEFPELTEANGLLPTDLIYEEYHVRRQTAEPPDPSEFLRRFPREADQLRRMLDLQGGQTSTLAVGSRKRPLDIGNQIDDFDVLTRLGDGAFASVYLARQRSMQRIVALKVSRDQGTEPQTLAQLDHANIVRVYDQRIIVERRLRLLYMQHVPGGTLQDVVHEARNSPFTLWSGKTLLAAVDRSLEKHGESPPSESSTRRRLAAATWPEAICWLGARLAAALDYAHRRGVLHRDVKPANVLLSAEGTPKLADFNVSFSSKLDGATPAAYFGGSLAYMSPEQLEASDPDHPRQPEELDGRSDLYSLAVMLWELLTGTRPFGEERIAASMSETLKQLAARRRAGVPPSAVAALPNNLPGGLKEVLLSCLAPEPADRPADGAEVARQLELCLRPRAQGLFRPKPGSLREMLRKYPVLLFILAGVLPHGVVSVFNTFFNNEAIISHLGENHAQREAIKTIFYTQVVWINLIAYSIGIGYGLYLSWPVLVAVRRYYRGRPPDPSDLPRLRRRSLWIGDYVTWLGFALWFVTGLVFPIWLGLQGGFDEAQTRLYVYFFVSQIICGLIACAQTFFQFSLVTVRGFHPLFMQLDRNDLEEIDQLLRLDRRLNWYLGMAISAPFIAFLALGLTEFTNIRWATIALAIIGIGSLYLAWRTQKNIQGDIAALLTAMDPERAASPSSIDTVESFWTSSR